MEDCAPTNRPFTGTEYIESLRDGRRVYLEGERIDNVTEHPAFRNSVRSVGLWYDTFHAKAAEIGVETDTGSKSLTHPFFRGAKTADDMVKSTEAIMALQRPAFGWMGRAPDYKASFLGTLGCNADYYGDYAANARRWYAESQERLLYWNHAIVNPPIDRNRAVEDVRDVIIHVEKETDAGVVVSGAKVVATGSALTHYNFIAHYGIPLKDRTFAIIFGTPMSAPGISLIARTSYELNAARNGSPFDYPLSSRFDENDSILVFDKVLVPWENIFLYGDIDAANGFFPRSGFLERAVLHGCSRLVVKLEFIAGLFASAVKATGTADFRGVQTGVGEVLGWAYMFRSLMDSMSRNPEPWHGTDGYVLPNAGAMHAARIFAGQAYGRIKELIERHVASGLIYLPSSAADFKNPEIGAYLNRFVRGSGGMVALDRVKLLKLLWDAIGTEFGGRHELYERNYAGNYENLRVEALMHATATGRLKQMTDLVDSCLSDYDLDGWTSDRWVGNDDVKAALKMK